MGSSATKPKRKRRCRRKKRAYKTGTYVSTKTGQECKYRSGWEQRYLEYLDNDPEVVTIYVEWECFDG